MTVVAYRVVRLFVCCFPSSFPLELPPGRFPLEFPPGVPRWTSPLDFPPRLPPWIFPLDLTPGLYSHAEKPLHVEIRAWRNYQLIQQAIMKR